MFVQGIVRVKHSLSFLYYELDIVMRISRHIDVPPSKCILIYTTDVVVVHYGCEFYSTATIN